MDIVSKEVRSRMMAGVKTKDTAPEIKLRKALHALGFRYRKNHLKLPGKPDIVFIKHKLALFVHGCFWHGHSNCKKSHLPKSNTSFWVDKIEKNKIRDLAKEKKLHALGYKVLTLWECDIKNDIDKVVRGISKILTGEDKKPFGK